MTPWVTPRLISDFFYVNQGVLKLSKLPPQEEEEEGGGGGQQASRLVAKQAVEFPQVLASIIKWGSD